MATIRLVPSGYSVSSSNRVTVSNPANMYYNTDHTANYCSIRGRNSSSSTYYAFINGFNFSDVPANAAVTAFAIKIRCYKNSYLQQGTSYRPRLASSASNNNVLSNTTLSSDVTTTSGGTVYTFPNGSLTWNTLKGYGSNFSIEIPLRSSGNSYPYLYVYGAEIEVTYTASDVHVTGVTLDKSTDTIEQGETTTLTATVAPSNATNKAVTWSTSSSAIATVSDGVVTGVGSGTARITVTTADGGYTDYCDVTVTQPVYYEYTPTNILQPGKNYLLANGNTGSVYLLSNEANGSRKLKAVSAAVVNGKISITGSVKAKCEFSCSLSDANNNVTTCIMNNGQYLYCDNSNGLRMNTVANIDRFWHYNSTKFWQFKSTAGDGYSDTSSEYKYYLTLSGTDFTDAHVDTTGIEASTIPAMFLFTESTGAADTMYLKVNGSWIEALKVYKKVSGSWVEQTDLTQVFDPNVNYKKVS